MNQTSEAWIIPDNPLQRHALERLGCVRESQGYVLPLTEFGTKAKQVIRGITSAAHVAAHVESSRYGRLR